MNPVYELANLANRRLIPFLSLDPVYNAHALFVCETKPEARSLAAVSRSGGHVEGALVTGSPGIPQVQGHWLTVGSRGAAEFLLRAFHAPAAVSLSYPLWAEAIVLRRFPRLAPQRDNLCVFPGASGSAALLDAKPPAVRLTGELYASVVNPEQFSNWLLPQDLLPVSKFYGILEGDRLCAIGEHTIETSAAGVISQMFTLPERRGKGYATSIASALTAAILSTGRLPVVFFTESNTSSRRVFERLGYVLHTRTGYVERARVSGV